MNKEEKQLYKIIKGKHRKKRKPIDIKGLVELSKKIELEKDSIYKS